MARSRLPSVFYNSIQSPDETENQPVPVVVGTEAWYSWLINQHIQSFSFRHPLGTFTVRRERKRYTWYWYAYCKRAGRLRKAYLGKTEELTLERLNAAAIVLNDQDESGRDISLITSDSIDGKEQLFLSQVTSVTYQTEQAQANGHNLPPQRTPMIGREQEVATVCTFLRQPDVRLLTLTGTGGVGKTSLGLQVAIDLLKDYADGVFFVSLAPISDPNGVIPIIAQTLGLRESGDQSINEDLSSHLYKRHVLLFLDNFEQVINAAPVLAELLERCLWLKILVTSRERLHIRAEQEFSVLPLALPNLSNLSEPESVSQYTAVALFLQRVRSYRPDFQLTPSNARTIAAICVHLDGLPLALELAAARLRLLSPQALLSRLEHRLQFLTQGPRDVPTRQQTLRNTLQWSYDLLDIQEQCLFRRLAVFVGGCTLEAVEAVCKASGDVIENVVDKMTSLLDKNLVQQERSQGDEETRFVMLETIREFALECLSSSGEPELNRLVHANYYLELAEEVGPTLEEPQSAVWLVRLEQEHDNLRAAMWWSLEREEGGQGMVDRREMALRFGVALWNFWVIHGYWSEGRTFLERVLADSEEVATPVRARALEAAASLAVYQIDHKRGEILCKENLALCRTLGDMKGTAFSLCLLGTIAWQRGDFAEARARMEDSLVLYKEVGDKEDIASVLTCLGQLATPQGEYTVARAYLEESLAIGRDLGNARSIAISLFSLALTLFVSQGDHATVHSLLEESLVLSKELGDKACIAHCLSHSGLVALHQGDAAMAHRLLEESLALNTETGNRWGISWVLCILAKVEACQGNYTAALTLFQESMAIARRIGGKLNIAVCLEGMASVFAAQGEPLRAAQLLGAAEALREAMGAPIWPVEHTSYELSATAARGLLGKRAYLAAWDEGRTMVLEQILVTHGPPTSPTKSRGSSTAGLTKREIEVLRLLAIGLTSTQIASQLMISLATVNTHVSSIYTKLGITSRSAATRYAVKHQLV